VLAQAMSETKDGNVIPLTAAAGIALCFDECVKAEALRDASVKKIKAGSVSSDGADVGDDVLDEVLYGGGYSVLEAAGGPSVLGAVAESLISASEVRVYESRAHFEFLGHAACANSAPFKVWWFRTIQGLVV